MIFVIELVQCLMLVFAVYLIMVIGFYALLMAAPAHFKVDIFLSDLGFQSLCRSTLEHFVSFDKQFLFIMSVIFGSSFECLAVMPTDFCKYYERIN